MALFGPLGPPQGGTPPLPGLEALKIPPRRGGWAPGTPPGGVRIWPASPFFIGNLQGARWQTKGAPLVSHFLALLTPPGGGPPPSGTPPGGVPPPYWPPQGPSYPSPRGVYPPPPKGPDRPSLGLFGRICRRLIVYFLRVCQSLIGDFLVSTGVSSRISPLGGGHSQISSTKK